MDPILGAMVMALVLMRAPAAIADAYTAMKAANAGEWDALDKQHERRDARAQRRHDLAERILARRRAKADGQPKRPGLGTFLGDVWHGMWEDALEQRTARRANRPPADPGRPTLADRVTERIRERVQLHRPPTPPKTPPAPRPRPTPPPAPTRPDVTGPRCPECGLELTRVRDRWEHPDGPACPITGQPYGQPAPPQPDPIDHEGDDMTATAEEIQTNEALRQSLRRVAEAARKLAEAAALAEQARAIIAAEAGAAGDGVAVKRFDAGATSAVAEIQDTVSTETLTRWAEAADTIGTAAETGLASLEKYQDAEELVAEQQVDASTLAATQS